MFFTWGFCLSLRHVCRNFRSQRPKTEPIAATSAITHAVQISAFAVDAVAFVFCPSPIFVGSIVVIRCILPAPR